MKGKGPPSAPLRAPLTKPQGPMLRRLHWTKHRDVKGSIWEALEDDVLVRMHVAQSQPHQEERVKVTLKAGKVALSSVYASALSQMFTLKESKTLNRKTNAPKTSKPKKKGELMFVSLSRANNISIMLTQFKMSDEDMCRAIAQGDPDKVLGVERITLLQQVLPTPEEAKLLVDFTGCIEELSKPERYLVQISQVPRLQQKAQALYFMCQFNMQAEEARCGLLALQSACTQVLGSRTLRACLGCTLAAGNMLNRSTHQGDAKGFSLETLLKLGDMRATPAATLQNECASGKKPAGADESAILPYARNLLEFVVAMVMEQGLEGIQSQDCQLKLELDTLKATRSELKDQAESILRATTKGLKDVRAERDAALESVQREAYDRWTELVYEAENRWLCMQDDLEEAEVQCDSKAQAWLWGAEGVECRSVAGKVDRDECDGSRCETSSSECGACSATNTAGCESEAACLHDIAEAQRRYADVTEREQSALRSLLELRDDEALNVSTRAGVEADTDEGKLFRVLSKFEADASIQQTALAAQLDQCTQSLNQTAAFLNHPIPGPMSPEQLLALLWDFVQQYESVLTTLRQRASEARVRQRAREKALHRVVSCPAAANRQKANPQRLSLAAFMCASLSDLQEDNVEKPQKN